MIPKNIKRQNIIDALEEIDNKGIPEHRESTKYLLNYQNTYYPPKYVISIANKYANGVELPPSEFSGGKETNLFLEKLGFTIKSPGERDKDDGKKDVVKSEPHPKSKQKSPSKSHYSHCSECKNVIFEMLRKIYGSIKIEHKIRIPARIEAYKETDYYSDLLNIYNSLKSHRNNDQFVRSNYLQACDIYLPNQKIIVELDETQHFSELRGLTLVNYPKDLELGFDRDHWIQLCESTKAKDNNPVYRDEQRAWYDTLRDFYPIINGGNPTIRIYMSDLEWCKLDVHNPKDVEMFKRYCIEKKSIGNQVQSQVKIGTVCLESDGRYDNRSRLELMYKITEQLSVKLDLLLFPAGYFYTEYAPANSKLSWLEQKIKNHLNQLDTDLVVCFGLDGNRGRDQYAVSCSEKGILSIGRKFHPAPNEYIDPAESFLSAEEGFNRIIEIKGKKIYTAVCYDSFGIKHHQIQNPGVDGILNLVHQFWPKGQGNSGDVFFARHGFAGAAKQWNCPVLGAAVFFNREVPDKWPTGVTWSLDNKLTTRYWKYENNTFTNYDKFELTDNEKAIIKFYKL